MIVCHLKDFGVEHLEFTQADVPKPGFNQVLVRMTAASLNYRDLMVVKGAYNPKLKRPMVPLSDGAGVVEALGEGATRFKVGDRVIPIFMQKWIDGPVTREKGASALGGAIDGVLREYALFDESGLVPTPELLTDIEAAALPCAAVTAWHALFECGPVRPGQTVVLQGTGGVSLFALQFAKAAGLQPFLISSSDSKLVRARELGASLTLNYKSTPDWEEAVRKQTGGVGVDRVIEVGGSSTFPKSLRAVAVGGTIAAIGVLSGTENSIAPAHILMNSIRVQGVYVGSRQMFEDMNRALVYHSIRPVIDCTFPWTEMRQALEAMETQAHLGKICLTF